MKTTINIPDEALADALRYTGAKTKREAVVTAMQEFNRRRKMGELVRLLGTFEDFMTPADLARMRSPRTGRP